VVGVNEVVVREDDGVWAPGETAPLSNEVAWVAGFRVAERFGIADRFLDDRIPVWVDAAGVVHGASCPVPMFEDAVTAASPSQLSIGELLAGQVGACCAATDEVWETVPVDTLQVADRLLSRTVPLRDWFSEDGEEFRNDCTLWALDREAALSPPEVGRPGGLRSWSRVAGSALEERLAELLPALCAEFADRLRLQQVAAGALAAGASKLSASVPDISPDVVQLAGWRRFGSGKLARWTLRSEWLCAAGAVNEAVCAADVVAVLEQQVAALVAAGGSVSGVSEAVACAVEVFEAPPVWLFAAAGFCVPMELVWPSASDDVTTVMWLPLAAARMNSSPLEAMVESPLPVCPSSEQLRLAAVLAAGKEWDAEQLALVPATAMVLSADM
jgi:hypothetical protein